MIIYNNNVMRVTLKSNRQMYRIKIFTKELIMFDTYQLHDRPYLRLKEVMELTGLAESTIWKHIRTKKFIQPYRFLGRIVMFKKDELFKWMEAQKC